MSGGSGEIVWGGAAACSTSIAVSFLLSASLLGYLGPLKGNLSAFVGDESSFFSEGVAPTVVCVVTGRSGGVPALMIVVRIKRAPTSGAHNRASQTILGIAASLRVEFIRTCERTLSALSAER